MIDIDKFITSLLQWGHLGIPKDAMCFALKEQGLEFRDGSISKVEPSIPEIVEEHFDEMLEDKSNPDNLHQYLYGDAETKRDIIAYLKVANKYVPQFQMDEWIAWLEKQGNLMKALQISNAKIGELIEKNYYLKEQLEKQGELKKHDVCDNCEQQGSCVSPCPMKLVEKQGEQKPVFEMKTPEESLGIDSDTYNKIVDECVYGKQKSAWSEEDKEMSRFIGNAITADDSSVYLKSKGIEVIDAHVWLDELKDRVQPQPKQEWSEEDNRMCKAIIDNIQAICKEGYFVGNIDSGELIDWLKSLRPQSQWRPSDEQMDALHYVTNFDYGGHKATLVSLYEQLKKLKG